MKPSVPDRFPKAGIYNFDSVKARRLPANKIFQGTVIAYDYRMYGS